MKKILQLTAILLIVAQQAQARSYSKGAGSSTVYPFITAAAESFARVSDYSAPIIEATGTGGGFKLFCSGIGAKYTDFSNASRQIKASEIELCKKAGITNIIEVQIGFDGIVLADKLINSEIKLSLNDIFLALARDIPQNGQLVTNNYKYWSDIRSDLPKREIIIYGPPPTSGTRDAFVELVMQKTCENFSEYKTAYPDKKTRKKYCSLFREDGVFIEAGENDNIIVNKLVLNDAALGIFGYSFLEQNSDKVKGLSINNVYPSFDNIAAQSYPVARSLFIYVKQAHLKLIPSLKPFITELISEDSLGEDGYLTFKGLIPLREEQRTAMQQQVSAQLN